MRLVPTTSHGDMSHRVNWPFLLTLVPATSPTNSFWDKSLRLVPQNASCELFVGLVQRLVAGTSPLVCADLYVGLATPSQQLIATEADHQRNK